MVALLFLSACATPSLTAPLSSGATTSTLSPVLPTAVPISLPSATPLGALAAPDSTKRPNIVFVFADDLDADVLKVIPRLQPLTVDQGTPFSRLFLNLSLCCPSRTTILRGQYETNTQVFGNNPPDGGFAKVYSLQLEQSRFAVWLRSAGHRTMLTKYLSGFPDRQNAMHDPPEWSERYGWRGPICRTAER